jgi:tRNA/tmRNA/rRNA uracil-C5-methylase (TrmA/RlmC/RlmD family)
VTLLELQIGPVAHGGHCVARHEGRVVFVRHTLPGERVLARVTSGEDSATYWRADAVEILTPSPDRVEPPCPWAKPDLCGGCDWQHATPAAQRVLKASVVTEQLSRLAGLEWPVTVEAVEPYLGWRTRVRFAVSPSGQAGLRKHRSHEIVPIDWCRIADPSITELDVTGRRWPDADAIEAVAPGTPSSEPDVPAPTSGAEQALVGRRAAGDATSTTPRPPTADHLPRGGVRPGVADTPVAADPRTAPGPGEQAGSSPSPLVVVEPREGVPGERLRLPRVEASLATRDSAGLHRVRGRTWVPETVTVDGEEQSFRVSGAGFWQVHPSAAQTLLDTVLSFAEPLAGEKVLDLYCGVGLFAAGLAHRVGPDGSVLAVESEERAIKDARRSLHDLPQVLFEVARAERVVRELASQAVECDLVVLDPPRSGAGRAVMADITALRPRAIVYVACDPAALARDIAFAASAGYELTQLRSFDLFPMTAHVECVALLTPVPTS